MYTKHGWWFPDEDTHFCEMLDKNIAKGNKPVYQYPIRKLSIDLTREKKVALDIGANIGLWSRDLCSSFEKVIAFEPVPQFIDCLIKNVPNNNLEIKECALGNENTAIEMIVTEGNTGHSHVNKETLGTGSVPMYCLDSFEFDRIDYIKIDCEGYEYNILQGAKETILRHKPVIVVEQKLHKMAGISKATQYQAADLIRSWGAKTLGKHRHDVVLGW